MIEIGVAGIATLVEPSAAASTAAGLAGIRKGATLGARTRRKSSRSSACRGGSCGCVVGITSNKNTGVRDAYVRRNGG